MESSNVRAVVLISLFMLSGIFLISLGLSNNYLTKLNGQAVTQNCNVTETCGQYFLVCKKAVVEYGREWHEGKCNPDNCGQDTLVKCDQKNTFWTNYSSEICSPEKEYYTSCSLTPNCGQDKEIKRVSC